MEEITKLVAGEVFTVPEITEGRGVLENLLKSPLSLTMSEQSAVLLWWLWETWVW